jgi:hypothetical protein
VKTQTRIKQSQTDIAEFAHQYAQSESIALLDKSTSTGSLIIRHRIIQASPDVVSVGCGMNTVHQMPQQKEYTHLYQHATELNEESFSKINSLETFFNLCGVHNLTRAQFECSVKNPKRNTKMQHALELKYAGHDPVYLCVYSDFILRVRLTGVLIEHYPLYGSYWKVKGLVDEAGMTVKYIKKENFRNNVLKIISSGHVRKLLEIRD